MSPGAPPDPPVAAPAWSTELDAAETDALLRTFSDFVWKADAEGRLATDMPQWRRITGQTADELLGHGWVEGVHPDDRERVAAAWQAAVDARGVYDVQYRIAGAGGERWYHARAAPVLDADGAPARWVGTVVDVTTQRALQEDAARQRSLLEQVIAESPMAIAVLWGERHELRFFNGHLLELVPPERVHIGATAAEVLPEPGVIVPMLDRVRAGEPLEFDELAVPAEGAGSFDGHRFYQGSLLPVLDHGRPGGVLVVATEVTEQVRRRESLAEQVRHERQAAERLQRALLPGHPPDIEGLEVALAYLPAGEDVGVGGDWYDVLPLPGRRVLLIIGDVAGRGMQAATWMSQMRAAVRAYAARDPAPATVLDHCAELAGFLGMPDMISAAAGLLDLADGTLHWASAGHPAPLLLRPGRDAVLAAQHGGPPIGAGQGGYRTSTLRLEVGEALVLYTDGAVEDRRRRLDDGIAELLAVAPDPAEGVAAVRDALAAHVQAKDGEDDDVALLVVRRTGR